MFSIEELATIPLFSTLGDKELEYLAGEVVAGHGTEQLEAIEIINRSTGITTRRDAKLLFVLIGAEAATDWLPSEVSRDEHGFVLTGTDAM